MSGGSVGVAGAALTLAVNRAARSGSDQRRPIRAARSRTTVTPDVWDSPRSSVTVTVADEASQASDSVAVVGANVLVGSSNYFGQFGYRFGGE